MGITGSLGMYVLTPDYSYLIYIFAVFMGACSGLMLTTGTNLISEVVGKKGKQGAFVYGIYSFVDKCVVGLLVYVVTHADAYSSDDYLNKDEI